MAGLLSYAAAGAAQGLGQGIAARGKAKREEKLREIEHQREMQRDERQFERRSELVDKRLNARRKQDERAWDRKKNQIVDTYQGENGMVGIRADGSTTTDLPGAKREYEAPETREVKRGDKIVTEELRNGEWVKIGEGGRWKPEPNGSGGEDAKPGLTPEEDRLLDTLTKRHTKENQFGETVTDWDTVASELRRRGNENLADWVSSPQQQGMDKNEAKSRARAEADDLAGQNWFWESDQEAFGGKTKEQWITERTQELMRGGSPQRNNGSNRSTAQASDSGSRAGRPKSDAMTPKSQRGQSSQSQQPAQSSSRPTDSDPSNADVQAPKSASAVQQMEIENLRRYVESADKGELENLPMSVRSEIVKRLRGNE